MLYYNYLFNVRYWTGEPRRKEKRSNQQRTTALYLLVQRFCCWITLVVFILLRCLNKATRAPSTARCSSTAVRCPNRLNYGCSRHRSSSTFLSRSSPKFQVVFLTASALPAKTELLRGQNKRQTLLSFLRSGSCAAVFYTHELPPQQVFSTFFSSASPDASAETASVRLFSTFIVSIYLLTFILL